MIDNNKIVDILRTVMDPVTGQDIISMKMVEGLSIKGNVINFSIKVPKLDADIKSQLNFACIGAITAEYPNADVNLHIIPQQGETPGKTNTLNQIEQAVVLRGPRLGGIIKQFINDCLWPELDFLVIDLPPGTGDIQLTLVQTIPVTGVVMVTTPQEVAVIDAVKAMNMFQLNNVNVPIVGVVENMSWFTPAELPDNKYKIFGEGGGQKIADLAKTSLIGQIPLVQAVREGGDSGNPIIAQKDHPASVHFVTAAKNLIKQVEKRNKDKEATKVVKMVR